MNYEATDAETVAGLLLGKGDSGISVRQLRNYCDLGCPYEERDRKRYFNWHKVLAWYIVFKSGGTDSTPEEGSEAPVPHKKPRDLHQENLRKTTADADIKELQLSKMRSEVITTTDAKIRLDRMMGNLRSRLLSLPPKVSARINGLKEPAAREAAIKEELEAICRDISTGSIVDIPEEAGGETAEEVAEDITAAADEQPVFLPAEFGFDD